MFSTALKRKASVFKFLQVEELLFRDGFIAWTVRLTVEMRFQIGLNRPFLFTVASVSKRHFVENSSYENKFDLHENEPVGGTHFHMNSFTLRLVLTQSRNGLIPPS